MAKPESSLWDYLRKVLPLGGHYSRIESDTCPGFPDVHYTVYGHTGTIELKSGKAPFKQRGLRKTQIDWIAEQDIAHGAIWIIAEVDHDDGPIIFLIDGNVYFEEFNSMDIRRLREVATYMWFRGVESPTGDLAVHLAEGR